MGNLTTAFENLPPQFMNLNEDNMVVLLQYLDVADFVHLTQTSKKLLNETLGPNNYLWAQLLNRPVPPPKYYSPDPSPAPGTRLVNHVLQTTRDGRKWPVGGAPLNLAVPFDTVNKHLVSHFDFRSEIKSYFLRAVCVPSLLPQLMSIVLNTNANVVPAVRVLPDVKLADYDTKSDVVTDGAVTDVAFVVDLGVNSASLESLLRQLPGLHMSRRVVYVKSNVPAQWAFNMTRSRTVPTQPGQPNMYGNVVSGRKPGPVGALPTQPQPSLPPGPQHFGQPQQPQPYWQPQPFLPPGPQPFRPPQPLVPPQPTYLAQQRQPSKK